MSDIEVKNPASGVDASGEESAGEMTWSRPVFDKQDPVGKLQNQRLLKKKRSHYNSVSHAGLDGLSLADASTPAAQKLMIGNRAPYGKNSRKSRNGFKQVPKKANGKDVWIRVSDELDELELDHGDPDYDSEEAEEIVFENVNASLDDDAFENFFSTLVHEYYDHCKVEEVIDGLKEIAITPLQRRRLPYLAINMALQQKLAHCELTSELLSELCGKIITMSGMQQGFQLLLDDMADIVLDVPKAPEFVGRFIARAIADDILPPKFVQQYKEISAALPPPDTPPATSDTVHPPVRIASRRDSNGVYGSAGTTTHSSSGIGSSCTDLDVNYALLAIQKAEALLTLSHAYRHLDIVWGIPPSERVTTMLMKQIGCILEDYLESGSCEGVVSSLQELDSPHFHHEVVYQAILLLIERASDQTVADKILRLLDRLCRSVVISLDQLVTGVKRIYTELPDIQADLPVAHLILERFLKASVAAGYLPQKLANEMPAKPRKRYVSEGDCVRKPVAPVKRF